jgi:hypothetical protein
MGSSQSAPTAKDTPMSISTPPTDAMIQDTTKDPQRKKKSPPNNLSGVALVEYKCRKNKKAWRQCVGGFYDRFSSGKALEDEEPDCDDLFEGFRQCYMRGMLKERQKKGLDTPKEGTILAQFIEDEDIIEPQNKK